MANGSDTALNDQVLLSNLRRTLPHGEILQTSLPLTPAISLWLIDPEVMHTRLSEEVISAVFGEPAYWSFCWASGQALARRILEQPQLVAGKTVLDFGCGSGVAAIAAARAGAGKVIACDLDADALAATRANARLNQVALELIDDLFELPAPVDVLLAADVLYDWENKPLLPVFREKASHVIIADSRVRDFAEPGYGHTGSMCAVTLPDLGELEEFKTVNFYESLAQSD